MPAERRRVFLTGLGCVAPHGDDPRNVFDRVYAGESAITPVRFADEGFGSEVLVANATLAGEDSIPKAQGLFMARAAKMAVLATGGALSEAGLLDGDAGPEEAGIYMGCGLGGAEVLQDAYRTYHSIVLLGKRRRRGRPTHVPMIMANGPASHVSLRYGIRGPAHTYSIACASSAVAVGEAFRAIRDGYLDVALAGGAEAMLNEGSVMAWVGLGVIAAEHADGPAVSCRPFDRERTGLVLGEGAAMLVLESEERVEERGAEPIAEIVGYGTSSDAHNLTEPDVNGQAMSLRAALGDARVEPDAVGYVNAHATGTETGDPVEIEAVRRVFGEAADHVAISSTKAVHGHLLGAAGALEALLTALALEQGRIPPTAHLTDIDPACDLDCVPREGREAPDLRFALSNSFAFGGSNAALVLAKV